MRYGNAACASVQKRADQSRLPADDDDAALSDPWLIWRNMLDCGSDANARTDVHHVIFGFPMISDLICARIASNAINYAIRGGVQ